MDKLDPIKNDDDDFMHDRLSGLSVGDNRRAVLNPRRTWIIQKLRILLPLFALAMVVVIVTWDDAQKHIKPLKKEELLPKSENIKNELLKPVFNSVDNKNQPFTVSADRAVQNITNPDLLELENPTASLIQANKTTVDGKALSGLYEQKTQKLNLKNGVELKQGGYTLKTQELRVDLKAQKAYSGQDVFITGPSGALEAKGLEGDTAAGTLIFTGPARIIINNQKSLKSKEQIE